jgi:hypothetical protein
MKIPNVAVPKVSNMTCHPKAGHLNQVFALFDKCSYLPPVIPVLVPTCSHCFPDIFPDHSWILPGFDYMSSLEADFCKCCSLLKETSRFLIVSLEILKFFPAHSMTSLAKRFLDSLLILLVPTQAEAAPIEAARLATQR